MSKGPVKKLFLVVLTLAILLTGGIAGAAYVGWSSTYGYMTVLFNQDGSYDTSEMYWAYYLSQYGVADNAVYNAYYGMGLDVLPLLSCYRAYYVPTLYITYDSGTAEGWTDGSNLYLNTKYLNTVTETDWLTILNPYAWWKGSTIAHDMSHVFYRQVTGRFVSTSYWDNLLTESLAHYVGNCVWPAQNPYITWPTTPATWSEIGEAIRSYWSWNAAGWGTMPNWSGIATTYNYGGSYGERDRLHFCAFGYFLANYYDFSGTGYTGPMGSYGYYSPLSSGGFGGSWNVGYLLWQMGTYGYSAVDALANVYSPPGSWYTPDLDTMPHAFGSDLNSRYYWYWWLLAYYS
jgi:hypothetical protein